MIETQRYLLKFIRKCVSFPFYRNISNMMIDNDKAECTKDTKSGQRSNKTNLSIKKSEFKHWDEYYQDHKGSVNVCIIGGCEASMYAAVLLKQSRLIKRIHLVDAKDLLSGAILDANHIDTSPRIKYFRRKSLKQALKEINIIALMDETNLQADLSLSAQFEAASSYVCEMAEQIVQKNSESLVAVFARPVTATLPIVSEIYKLAGWWDPDKIIGSIALDRMRMETITANLLDLNPAFLSIPMIGGADSNTLVPLLSRASPINRFTNAQQDMLFQSLRNSDKEMAAIQCKGPYLSDGAAAAKLILALAGGLNGFTNILCSAYIRSNVLPVCRYFTSELQFGPTGVQQNFGIPKMSQSEIVLVEQAIPYINKYIEMAIKTVHKNRHIKQRNV